jgi:hypothetical protein
VATREWGEDTPSEPESMGGDNEEEDKDKKEGALPALEDLPSLGNLFRQQAGISIVVRQPKRPWTETVPSIGPPPQFSLTLVSSDMQGMSVALVVMGIAHLLEVL